LRIEGGTLNNTGNNLFHSFEEFSLPTGIEARFENSQTLENIFTRITGDFPSEIDGLLSVDGTANFFLLNPNGIIFGENAQLNLGGSFFATSAESLNFENGGQFSATLPENVPLLSINTPTGLQYGANPGSISNRSLASFEDVTPEGEPVSFPVGLEVFPGNTIGLIGGDVNLEGGIVSTFGGRIELGSVGDNAQVRLIPTEEGFALDYSQVEGFRDIRLSDFALVNASGEGGGSIQVQGRQVTLTDDSGITSNTEGALDSGSISLTAESLSLTGGGFIDTSTFGEGRGGDLSVTVSDLIELRGTNLESRGTTPEEELPSGFFTQTEAAGDAGNLTLRARRLEISDGAQISLSTFGGGQGGNLDLLVSEGIELSGGSESGNFPSSITTQADVGFTGNGGSLLIQSPQITLLDGAEISATSFGAGNAGNLTIRASEFLELRGQFIGQDNELIPSGIATQVEPSQTDEALPGRRGGDILIETAELRVFDAALITAATAGAGRGGDITVNTQRILARDGGQILSNTVSSGEGGILDATASAFIELTGTSPDGQQPSGLFTQSQGVLVEAGAGNAGALRVNTNRLSLNAGGAIAADTFLDGQGGSIAVNADRIELTGRSALPSGSPAADPDGRLPSRITAQTTGTGNAGGVTLNSPFLSITDGAQVGVDARLGGGAAGDVTLNIPDIRLQNNGRITGETASGQGGNLRFTSQDIRLLDDSNISTTAGTADLPGDGGNITINTNTLVGLGNSNISANAFDGSGGVIEITTEGLFGLQVRSRQDLEQLSDNLIEFDPRNLDSNDITAISRTNPDLSGLVNLNTPEVDPVSALVELEDRPVNAAVDQNPCIQGSETELVVTGGGGLPPSANDPFSGTGPWQDLRLDPLDDPQSHDNLPDESPQARSPSPQRIRQAQDWTLNAEGELVLTAPNGGSDYRPPSSEQNCSPQSQLPQSDKQNRPQSQQNQEFQVQNFHFVGNTVFSDEELAAETQNLLNRPLSFEELQTAADTITEHYEDKGYITSGAYIPPQTTENRVVTVQILEGTLEDIQVRTSGNLNPNYVVRRIERVVVGPVNQDQLIEALQLLQLDPHIDRLSAELAAGVQPGTNLLKVQVEEPNAVTVSLGLDNDRSPTVGSFRQQANSGIANLFGIGDVASLAYGNTEGTDNWNLGYQLPINALDGTVSLLYSTGDSRIVEAPFDQVDIQADTRTYEVSYRQPLLRQVQPRRDEENASTASDEGQNASPPSDYVFREFALGLTASRRDTQTSILDRNFPLSPGADNQGETNISVLRFFQDWTQRDSREVLALRSELSLGVDWFGATVNDDDPDSQFLSWQGQAQWVRRLGGGLETQQPETRLVLRGNAQLSADSLVPIEQFSLGGRRRMRGYRQDVLLADSGLFASAEVQIPLFRFARRQGTVWLAPFVEAGTVWNLGDRPNPDTSSLASAGLGLRLGLGDRLSAAFDWGIPLVELDTGNDSLQDNGLYFSIRFNPL
ncbi:MAG: ShlB/FhaC/HecB family hemolysin secretion/activation protein, partial [Phormidium sp.]